MGHLIFLLSFPQLVEPKSQGKTGCRTTAVEKGVCHYSLLSGRGGDTNKVWKTLRLSKEIHVSWSCGRDAEFVVTDCGSFAVGVLNLTRRGMCRLCVFLGTLWSFQSKSPCTFVGRGHRKWSVRIEGPEGWTGYGERNWGLHTWIDGDVGQETLQICRVWVVQVLN